MLGNLDSYNEKWISHRLLQLAQFKHDFSFRKTGFFHVHADNIISKAKQTELGHWHQTQTQSRKLRNYKLPWRLISRHIRFKSLKAKALTSLFFFPYRMPSKFEDVNYNLDVGEPPQELLDYAKEKWGETEATRPLKINELRYMIQGLFLCCASWKI